MIKKSWKGIFLKVHFWQIGTINIFWTGSIFHPKLFFSQIISTCIRQLAESLWVTIMKIIKKSWKGIFLKVRFWQIGTINIFWTSSIFHPKLVFSQIICNCIKQLAESPWVTKRTTHSWILCPVFFRFF